MKRIKQVILDNYRGYGENQIIDVDEADIVLISGKNGSGKTSLLTALSLALNGYDESVFKSLDLFNRFSNSKSVSIDLKGLDIKVKLESKNRKELQFITSPFQSESSYLNPSIRRVATAYFQDKATELASGEFLAYLTGAANQGQEIINWLKKKASEWKAKSESTIPFSKDWNKERINLLISISQNIEKIKLDTEFSSIGEFNPLLQNGQLRKDWNKSIVKLSSELGNIDENYGIPLIESIRKTLQDKLINLEEKWNRELNNANQKERTKNLILNEIQNFTGEIIQITENNFQSEGNRIQEIEKELDRLKKELEDSETKIPKDNSIEQFLDTLARDITLCSEEINRLESVGNPVPIEVKNLLETIGKYDINSILTSYVDWINNLRSIRNIKNQKISEKIKQRDVLQIQLTIFKLLKSNSELEYFTRYENFIPKNEIFAHFKNRSNTIIEENNLHTIRKSISNLLETLNNLIDLEVAFDNEQEELKKLDSLQKAKEYALEWSEVMNKESLNGGEIYSILTDLDLLEINNSLKTILSIFHLPEGLVKNLDIIQKGAGKNAILNPVLGAVDFDNLSTGQKTIFALAWTIVLNQSLKSKIGHQVMMFDDITTSLDLNQIIPACILFRKLAYNNDKSKKRQLFISSHHEDLTNKLIDNLIPPKDFTMKVLDLQDYTIQNGTSFESWFVSPGNEIKND